MYLQHYGILGMRWGTRRYQNRDGSLTKAGIRRYGESEETASSLQRYDRRADAAKSRKVLEKRYGEFVSELGTNEARILANFYTDSKRREAAAYLLGVPFKAIYTHSNTKAGKAYVDFLATADPDAIMDRSFSEIKKGQWSAFGDEFLSHAIFGIKLPWDENKVKRASNGRFAKQASSKTDSVAAKNTKQVQSKPTKDLAPEYNQLNPNRKEDKPIIEFLFALGGGLPGWVLYKLISAWEDGKMSGKAIRDAAKNAIGASLTRKISIINELLRSEAIKIDSQGDFHSLDDLPKTDIKSFEEVKNETWFEYTDWEDEGSRVGNCALSTFAYELQRRGYDVEAKNFENGSNWFDVNSIPGNQETVDLFKTYLTTGDDGGYSNLDEFLTNSTYDMYGATPADCVAFTNPSDMATYVVNNPEEFPPKSRGFLEIEGHILNYEVSNDSILTFMDGQQGGAIGDLVSGEIDMQTFDAWAGDQILYSPSFLLMRTDDKEINEKYLHFLRPQNDNMEALYAVRDALNYKRETGRSPTTNFINEYYEDIVDSLLDEIV